MSAIGINKWNLAAVVVFVALACFTVGAYAADLPKITWRLQSVYPSPEEVFPGAKVPGAYGQFVELARRVEKRTNGNFKIKVYLPDEICKRNECPEALMNGMIQALGTNGQWHVGVWPVGEISGNIPYSTKTYQEFVDIYTKTDYINLVRAAHAKKNVFWLCPIESASANLMTNFPVNSVADLKGKKIAASGPRADLLKAMGAVPVNVTSSEMYTALQRGTVDGITYPPYTGLSYKFFEVLKYVIWPGITVPSMSEVLLNLNAWNKLPKEYQKILDEEGYNMFVNEAMKKWGPKKDELAQKQSAKYGIKNIYLTDKAYNEMRQYTFPLWNKWKAVDAENAALIKIFEDQLAKQNKPAESKAKKASSKKK